MAVQYPETVRVGRHAEQPTTVLVVLGPETPEQHEFAFSNLDAAEAFGLEVARWARELRLMQTPMGNA